MDVISFSQIHTDLARIEADAASIAANTGHAQSDGAGVGSNATFAQTMGDLIREVDAKEQAASAKAEAVDSGKSDDLVGAMLASQEAGLSFSMLMQVRNKVMGAFDELIKLQL